MLKPGNVRTAETKKAPERRFILNGWVVQDKPRPVRGLALWVMLAHQPESLPVIQSNLRQVLILHVQRCATETKKAPERRFILNGWIVQDKPRPVRGLALWVMLAHQPESLPVIQSNLQQVLILHVQRCATETKKAPERRFILNWWVVQDKPRPVRGLALWVMLAHQPESLPVIQSNLQQVLILHVQRCASETKKAP